MTEEEIRDNMESEQDVDTSEDDEDYSGVVINRGGVYAIEKVSVLRKFLMYLMMMWLLF